MVKRDLNKITAKFGYKPSMLWLQPANYLADSQADALQSISAAIWNGLFGWLETIDKPSCRWVCSIGIGGTYRCELSCDHDGPHVYCDGNYRWYSREMPSYKEGNRAINLRKGSMYETTLPSALVATS